MQQGIRSFGSWTVFHFRKEEAFETAGKIAYIVAKIQKENYTPLLKFDSAKMRISDFLITELEYSYLNKKVKYANYAMFYWYQAIKVLKENSK